MANTLQEIIYQTDWYIAHMNQHWISQFNGEIIYLLIHLFSVGNYVAMFIHNTVQALIRNYLKV